MKLVAIDFEYKYSAEPGMGLISVAIAGEDFQTETYWLWHGEQKQAFIDRVDGMKDTHIFVGFYNQLAESRAFAALGLNPNDFKWRDLVLEWRWLRNGDDRYQYGRIVKNGLATLTVPPRYRVGKRASQDELDEAQADNAEYLSELQSEFGENLAMDQAGWSLLDCLYYFECIDLDQYRSALEVKQRIRDQIIINGTDADIDTNREAILSYNADDIHDLLSLADKLTAAMCEVGQETHICIDKGSFDYVTWDAQEINRIQLSMGWWAAFLAKVAHRGIPIHRGRLERLLEVQPTLLAETRDSWIRENPDTPIYRVGLPSRILEMQKQPKKVSPYVVNEVTRDQDQLEALIQSFCIQSGITNWPKTRSGQLATDKTTLDKFSTGENIIKQLERHRNALSTLKTFRFNPKLGRVEALDYIGSDDKQRPDFGPFGTQTARIAARATSYLFLGPHWLRVLVDPEPGMAIVELDYGSEEIWIAAVQGDDEAMQKAYLSEDFYVASAQHFGMYPQDLPIPTEQQRDEDWFKPFKKVRAIAKTLCLSIQFGAGYKSVAAAVRLATRDNSITDEQGSEWVNEFNSIYSNYAYMVERLRDEYKIGYPLALPGGWRMGINNPSVVSASNLPIQGVGAVILQEACRLIDKSKIKGAIIATLHDALTLYCREEDAENVAAQAGGLMKQAAFNILGKQGMKVGKPEIIKHGELWLHSDKAVTAWDKLKTHFAGTF